MDEKALQEAWERLQSVAEGYVRQMVIPYIKEEIAKLCSPSGEIGQQVISDSVAIAADWYGMYKPTVYRRGWTLTNEKNIKVGAGEVETDGYTASATIHVANVSPHAGYSAGFAMRNGKFRPAGDVVARGRRYSAHIDVPADVLSSIWMAAITKAAMDIRS